MVPKSAKKGLQRQQPAPGIAQSLIESVADVHEGFEDMLNNFGKLHIESPEAAIEHPAWQNHSSGWELAKELCTTYQLDRDVLPWWDLEVDEQVRCMGDSACQISNKELDMAALDTHFKLEHNSKGRIPLTEISPDLEESLALVDEVLPITSSSERKAVSPAMSRLPGESEIDWPGGSLYFGDHLQNHESVLELRVPKRDLPNEQPTFAPGFVREMIMKPDGSKFVVTSIHHLTTYKPSKVSHIVELPFGSFEVKKLKSILLDKLEKRVALDCITFTGTEQHSVLSERIPCLPSHRKSLKSSKWHVRTKMTPEDWHHILMVCDDEDWVDLNRVWHNFLASVSSDFLCSICDAGLPKPPHKRVWQLRGER
ncbi:hypothetical protein ONS96_005340 [Cadophora gregata f. sp. sojae]|nr:hypothetical protein ONS96_005340 [Cadophora gregata f. sp. sojae]